MAVSADGRQPASRTIGLGPLRTGLRHSRIGRVEHGGTIGDVGERSKNIDLRPERVFGRSIAGVSSHRASPKSP
jgi:hypothetical protein